MYAKSTRPSSNLRAKRAARDENVPAKRADFFNYSGKETEFFPVFKNGIFQQFSRSAVFPPSLYKKNSMVKVIHHSILDKIKEKSS